MEFHTVKQLLLQALELLEGSRPSDSLEQLRLQSYGAYCLAVGMLDRNRPANWARSQERLSLLRGISEVISTFWKEVGERRELATVGCDHAGG